MINSKISYYYNLAGYAEYCQKLAQNINEQLQIHTPLASQFDLEVTRTLIIEVKSRQIQLEKHFRQGSIKFNKGIALLQENIDKNKLLQAEGN
jgi:hypothetical protein